MVQDPNARRESTRLSRRQFVLWSGAATAAAVTAPAWMPRAALARDSKTRDVIVTVFLRGGADGLALCVPHGDAGYAASRGMLAIPAPGEPEGCIDLDGFFGLPPAMAALAPIYAAGHLAIVHATGSTHASRSHFEAQRAIETGAPGDATVDSGWLARHIATVGPMNPAARVRAVGIGSQLPQILRGEGCAAATMATPGGRNATGTSSLSKAFQQTGSLIRSDAGVEAVAIDMGGWDTHAAQGPRSQAMAATMEDLASTLRAFYDDVIVGGKRNVTVVVMSEFGRRAAPNASLGTDHGHGGCMFVIGRHINGGQVISQWPGLGAGQPYQNRDLNVTIDFRDILAEIVESRLGNTNLAAVFPRFTPTLRNIAIPG